MASPLPSLPPPPTQAGDPVASSRSVEGSDAAAAVVAAADDEWISSSGGGGGIPLSRRGSSYGNNSNVDNNRNSYLPSRFDSASSSFISIDLSDVSLPSPSHKLFTGPYSDDYRDATDVEFSGGGGVGGGGGGVGSFSAQQFSDGSLHGQQQLRHDEYQPQEQREQHKQQQQNRPSLSVTSPKSLPLALPSPSPSAALSAAHNGGAAFGAGAEEAEEFASHLRNVEADLAEVQATLMRLQAAVVCCRQLAGAAAVEETAGTMRSDLDRLLELSTRALKPELTSLRHCHAVLTRRAAACGRGTAAHAARLSVLHAIHSKLQRRQENVREVENQLNMGLRDTAKRRYQEVTGSTPSEETIDRLCSPALLECSIAFPLARPARSSHAHHHSSRRNQHESNGNSGSSSSSSVDEQQRMNDLLKEMDVRQRLASDACKLFDRMHEEIGFLIGIVDSGADDEGDGDAMLRARFEGKRKALSDRRTLICCLCMAALVVMFLVIVVPTLVVYNF